MAGLPAMTANAFRVYGRLFYGEHNGEITGKILA